MPRSGNTSALPLSRRLEDLDFRAEILPHHLAYVIAGCFQHFEPAVFPVADAGKPGGASAARKRFGAASLEVHPAVPVEPLTLPDFLDGYVIGVRKQLRGPERNVLAAQRNAAERVHVETLERPYARFRLGYRQVPVEVRIERLADLDVRVVVPREELPGNDFVDADVLHPEVDGRVEFPLNLLLPDDRHDDAGRRLLAAPQLERGSDVADRVAPPFLWIARRPSAMRGPHNGVGRGVTRIHRELDQVDAGCNHPFELPPQDGCRAEHAAIGVQPDARTMRL